MAETDKALPRRSLPYSQGRWGLSGGAALAEQRYVQPRDVKVLLTGNGPRAAAKWHSAASSPPQGARRILLPSPGAGRGSSLPELFQRLHLTFQLLEGSLLLFLQQLPNSARGTALRRSTQLIPYYRHQGHRVLGEEREPFPNGLLLSAQPELPNSTPDAALCRVQPADPAGADRAALLTATPGFN